MKKIALILAILFLSHSVRSETFDSGILVGEWMISPSESQEYKEIFEYININEDLSATLITDFLGSWENIKTIQLSHMKIPQEAGVSVWEWDSKETSMTFKLVLSGYSHQEGQQKIALLTGALYLYDRREDKLVLLNTVFKKLIPFDASITPKRFNKAINEFKQ